MPKVPLYQSQVTNENLTVGRDSTRADARSFGFAGANNLGAIGGATSNFGNAMLRYGVRSEDRKDRSIVRNKMNALRGETRALMNDIYNQRGENALDAYDKAKTRLEELNKTYNGQLKNENQKEYFSAAFDNLSNAHLNRALTFQENQRRIFEKTTMDAENESVIQDAVASRYETKQIQKSESTIRLNILAQNEGQDNKTIERLQANAVDKLHKAVLMARVKDSPSIGKQYLKDNWDKFNPITRTKLKFELDKMVDKEWVYNKGTEIANSGKSLEDQLKEVDKIKDTENATEVRKLVKDRHNEKQALISLEKKKVYEGEEKKIQQNTFNYRVPYSIDGDDRKKLVLYQDKLKQEKLAQQGLAPASYSNEKVRYGLHALSLEELKQVHLPNQLPNLSATHYNELLKKQNSKSFSKVNYHKMVNTAIKGMGEDFDEKEGIEEAQRQNLFRVEVEKAIATIPEKEITTEKVNAIINEMLVPLETDTGFFDGVFDKSFYRFEANELSKRERLLVERPDDIPENLKGFGDKLQFSPKDLVYYVEGNGVIRVYNLSGTLVDTYKKRK